MRIDYVDVPFDYDGEPIALALGQIAILRLPENPTTGYRWVPSADHFTLVDDMFASDPHSGVGGGGARTLRFEATAPGSGTIAIALRRAWENESNAIDRRTYTFFIR